jgi:hypothetical protein
MQGAHKVLEEDSVAAEDVVGVGELERVGRLEGHVRAPLVLFPRNALVEESVHLEHALA